MSLLALLTSIAVALLLAGAGVLLLRSWLGPGETFDLTFDTATSRARQGWAAFWARDPFVLAQRERTGMVFGEYAVPGSDPVAVRLAANDLQQHALVLGATGSGKSSLLEHLAHYHLRERRGFTLIDLHGDLFTRVALLARAYRPRNLVLIDFTHPDLLPVWNPLTQMAGVDVGRHVDLLVGVLKRLYAGETAASWAWGVKVEELTRWALRACIESAAPLSLVDLKSFLLDPVTRSSVLATASADAKAYWKGRFERTKQDQQYVSAVLNKLEPFLGSVAVQRFLGGPESTVDLLGAIERGDTVLINLAKGYLGPTADVTGRLIVNALQIGALQREHLPPEKRTPYSLLLDEAHVLAGVDSGLEDFLIAARKYKVFVTLAAQGLSLFPASFRPHLLGNTSRQFFFRLPYAEARLLARDIFEPLGSVWRQQLRPHDPIDDPLLTPAEEIAWRTNELSNLPVGACYWLLKGRPYRARRIQVLPPVPLPSRGSVVRKALLSELVAQKDGSPPEPDELLRRSYAAAIAERSERRNRTAGITNP